MACHACYVIGMKIRRRKYASGKAGWQLDMGIVDGRRFQKLFPTKEKAEQHADKLLTERRRYGDSALAMSPASGSVMQRRR